jgi:hypothetical protein
VTVGSTGSVCASLLALASCDRVLRLDDITPRDAQGGCPTGYLAYECFESGALPGAPWTTAAAGGGVIVDDVRAARGRYALDVSTAAAVAGSFTYDELREITTLADTPTFVRFFAYAPSPLPVAESVTLAAAIQTVEPYDGLLLEIDGSGHLQVRDDATGATATSQTTLPTDTWACLAWEIVSAPSGELHVWLDDQLLADAALDNMPTQPSSPIGWLEVGVAPNNPPADIAAYELWIDDLAIADRPISCAE